MDDRPSERSLAGRPLRDTKEVRASPVDLVRTYTDFVWPDPGTRCSDHGSNRVQARSQHMPPRVASRANLILNALNEERRLNALIITYRTTATPPHFPSRNKKTRLLTHPCLDQSLGTVAGGPIFSSVITIDPA